MKIHVCRISEDRLRAMRSGKKISLLTESPGIQRGDLLRLVDAEEDIGGGLNTNIYTDDAMRFMPAILWAEVMSATNDDPCLAAGCSLLEVMRFDKRGQRALTFVFPRGTIHAPHYDLGFRAGLHTAMIALGVENLEDRGLSQEIEGVSVVPTKQTKVALDLFKSLARD